MARIVFYCNDTLENLEAFEYSRQDIDGLRALGHDVVVCNRYRDIPRAFDALYIWWWTYALAPALWARLLRRPVIITGVFNLRFPRGFTEPDYFRRAWWQRLVIATAAKLATLTIFLNEEERAGCREQFGLRNTRLVPLALHGDYLQGPGPRRELVLFNLAWSGRQNLVRKGLPDLLEAVALLKRAGTPVRLRLAGREGDGVGFLRDLIKRLDIQDRVELLGPLSRSDKIALLRSCEIYVQPSHYEGFGLATAEAMGCGACIVTCDVGAVRTVVADCGVYVAPGRPDDLARAIGGVVADADRRGQLQAASLRRARETFRFDDKVRRLGVCLDDAGIPAPASTASVR
jgi:glycosyltransferase involved in cell wall biosynthesis